MKIKLKNIFVSCFKCPAFVYYYNASQQGLQQGSSKINGGKLL